MALAFATSACSHATSAPSSAAAAQPAGAPGVEATRRELETALAQKGTPSGAQVAEIQRRLREGDFQPGDRVFLQVEGETALTDTFTVRSGPTLDLPQLSPLSLRGVLRSELDSVLTQHVGQFIRSPRVEAIALIRVAVLGGVSKPGFYDFPAESRATDMVMFAGGPTGNVDLQKSYVARGGVKILEYDQVQAALARGQSLDQMNLASGDQFVVGQSGGGLLKFMPYVGAATALAFAISRIAGN